MTRLNSVRPLIHHLVVLGFATVAVGCKSLPDLGAATNSATRAAAPVTGSITGQPLGPKVSKDFYSIIFDQADHLEELLATPSGLADAARLYVEQRDYFADTTPANHKLTARLAAALNAKFEPDLRRMTQALIDLRDADAPSRWPQVHDALQRARQELAAYKKHRLLERSEFRSQHVRDLDEQVRQTVRRWRAQSARTFSAFDHENGGDFFTSYPVGIDRVILLGAPLAAIEAKWRRMSVATLTAFGNRYDADRIGEVAWQRFSDIVLGKAVQADPAATSSDPFALLAMMPKLGIKGLAPAATARLRIGFVEATSPTLIKTGQIDFPAGIDIDLPVSTARVGLDAAFDRVGEDSPTHLVIFEVAQAKASRRVVELKGIPSTVFIGYEGHRRTTDSITAQGNPELASAAIDQLYGKRKGVGAPVFAAYNFDKAKVVARKVLTVNYYLVDIKARTFFKSTFDVQEADRFEIAYRIRYGDPKKNIHRKRFQTEADVDDFEKASTDVRLSQLLAHYVSEGAAMTSMGSVAALRASLIKDRNTAIQKAKANTFDSRPLNDPRFDSVVVVSEGGGGLGSGFFVMPDVVMTNWHVVEDKRFVEMRLYDGTETFGTVLGRDARLDVALVRVQTRGKPVRFYTGTRIDLGATAEAIGHPRRYRFSITRGVVSAVRREYSINLPRRAGDKVLYIQTDAAISPGNSGGPLFLDDYVIGMNTWGESAAFTENIAFAVHYAELLAFLKEHLPGFQVLR